MTALALTLVGLLLVAAPGLPLVPWRLRPSEWSRLAVMVLLAGFVAVEAGLTLFFLPSALALSHDAGFVKVCAHAFGSFTPFGTAGSLSAGALAVVVGVRAWRAGRRSWTAARAAVIEPWLGRHEDRGEFDLVVLPTAELVAMTVPGDRPQMVLSDGLIDRLADHELEAVLRHEASHRRHRHWRYAVVAAAVDAGLRPFRPARRSRAALEFAVEAWADDDAAGETASRRGIVREAILAVVGAGRPVTPIQRQSHAERARRLGGVLAPTTLGARLVVVTPVTVTAIAAAFLAASWLIGLRHGLGLLGNCAG